MSYPLTITLCRKSTPPKVPNTVSQKPSASSFAEQHTSDNRVHRMACSRQAHLGSPAYMRKGRCFAKFDESQFCIVGMGRIVFQTVTSSPKKPESFKEICLVLGTGISSTELNAPPKELSDECCRGIDANILGGNIVFKSYVPNKLKYHQGHWY